MDCFHFYVIFLSQGPLILKIDQVSCEPPQSFAVYRKHSPAVLKARQNVSVVLSSARVWIKTQLLHKDKKMLSLLEDWIHGEMNTFERAKIWLITQTVPITLLPVNGCMLIQEVYPWIPLQELKRRCWPRALAFHRRKIQCSVVFWRCETVAP